MPAPSRPDVGLGRIVVATDRLFWLPEGGRNFGTQALDVCKYGAPEDSKVGKYFVRHYPEEKLGAAFGPLGLDALLRFCRGLDARLEPVGAQVTLSSPEGDKEYRANAAVLIGAYLVLREGWSTQKVASVLGASEATAKFACSWDPTQKPEKRLLEVRDCWQGCEIALRHGFLDTAWLDSDVAMEKACAQYDFQLTRYDSVWLVPDQIMVGADPSVVAHDANPQTFTEVFPPIDPTPKQSEVPRTISMETREDTPSTSYSVSTADWDSRDPEAPASEAQGHGLVSLPENEDFTTLLKRSGVQRVVRTNSDGEPGLYRGKSYNANRFIAHGLKHSNIFIDDLKPPLPQHVIRVLADCEDLVTQQWGDAVFIHCKAGFGRSVSLALCLAMVRYDVPGSALLGWARIVRPGAINSRMQELFLKSMKGRDDVINYSKIGSSASRERSKEKPCDNAHRDGIHLTCNAGCSVQ